VTWFSQGSHKAVKKAKGVQIKVNLLEHPPKNNNNQRNEAEVEDALLESDGKTGEERGTYTHLVTKVSNK